ncbi:unnamed protein product [Spirodela intermedia]|uniref:ENTH domain-containing protein n=1 Tax=Spirodela intermedia TaxID=51605 RepID=A0A7I8IVA9_SPIIN|nr:unnamed protein product [Spirodela intermedia]CAA6661748.1 unnamed protein product [Spirodela intermedia]
MVVPLFVELKKQASFFLREKIRIARLVLTDVTPTQLLAEEVTEGNPAAPDTRTMGKISRAAFELEDYWRIVDILHARLGRFDRAHWREAYNSLILLEHLLTHGPASIAEEFQSDTVAITEIQSFEHVDERGFNWGLAVRNKSERVLKLLEKGPLLREERDRARKLSRGIQGFGRFDRISSAPIDSSEWRMPPESCRRSNSLLVEPAGKIDQKENANPSAEAQIGKRPEAKAKPFFPGKENDVGRSF